MIFWPHFRHFLENYSKEIVPTWWKCSPFCCRAFPKNRMSKSFSVLQIFSLKVGIFGQNGENVVQRSANISRTVNAMKNLIRYSETRRISLSCTSDQIFHSYSSLGRNLRLKMVNFDPKNRRFWGVFGHYQPYYICPRAITLYNDSLHMYGQDQENRMPKLIVYWLNLMSKMAKIAK